MVTPALADHGRGMGMKGGGGWWASMTTEQQDQVAKLKLEYKKQKLPLKTEIKQAKLELAMLITSDNPSQKAIDKKIDQIVQLKSKKMHLKAKHKIAVRKVLNESQRLRFDMKILKKAYHGKGHGRHGRH